MKILKNNGNKVEFNPNKILNRVKRASKGLNIDYTKIVIEAQNYIYDGITTEQIDIQLSTIASSYIGEHPDYSKLASILIMSRLHKELNVGEVGSWYNRLESKLDDRMFYIEQDVFLPYRLKSPEMQNVNLDALVFRI